MPTWRDLTTARPTTRARDERAVPSLRVVYMPGKPVVGTPFRELRERMAIGRRVDALEGILLEDAAASRLHAIVEVSPGGVRFIDRSSNGSLLNGRRTQEAALADGDVLRLGDSLLVFRFRPPNQQDLPVAEIFGNAPAVLSLRTELGRVASSAGTVLILGESGTGKELVARALHERGSARRGPFVAVNMSAIPEQLAESQLFGHVAGAFSGATRDYPGMFRSADGGTLFLDEIGDLPLSQQPKLLRALEDGAVLPVGAVKPVRCQVRVIAATNLDIPNAVAAGRFRGDLYARLCGHIVRTPPVRERREDVLDLFTRTLPAGGLLEPDLAEALLLYPWPYNVRELLQLAKHAGAVMKNGLLRHVELMSRLELPKSAEPDEHVHEREPPDRAELQALLAQHKGQVATIARILGRSRRQVYRYLEAFNLELDSHRVDSRE